MARARNIKPGFFQNEDLVELSFEVRLLFIGLWTIADREGRLEDRPKRIKMAIFPADNIDVDAALEQLQSAGFLVRYDAGNMKAIQITNFAKHQNPHIKEAASTIPPADGFVCQTEQAPDEHDASTVQAPDEHDASHADSLIPDSLYNPPPTASVHEAFPMSVDWQPSSHFPSLAKQAGLPMPGTESFNSGTAEFKAYWISRNERRTQHEWDHTLVKSLKGEKARSAQGRAPPNGNRRQTVSDDRKAASMILTGRTQNERPTANPERDITADCQRVA